MYSANKIYNVSWPLTRLATYLPMLFNALKITAEMRVKAFLNSSIIFAFKNDIA